MRVRMLYYISGGRHDGTRWPDPQRESPFIDLADWEGRDLIRGGMAVIAQERPAPVRAYEDEPVPPAGTSAVIRPEDSTVHEPAPSEPPVHRGLGAPQPELSAELSSQVTPPPVSPPAQPAGIIETIAPGDAQSGEAPVPAAPKQAWIDWAITQGATEDGANGMTKADLMSRYGGRL